MKSCTQCYTQFEITDADREFYTKMHVPEPTHCPECRRVRRLTFRNARSLYARACDLCKQTIISLFPAETAFPVYCNDCWWSDRWDAHDFQQDIDFSVPFFEQLKQLIARVPKLALNNTNSVNSAYTNFATENKNCYMLISGWQNENVLYSMRTNHLKEAMECYNVFESELMYECLDCSKCYKLLFSQDCQNCTESQYLFDCRNCDYCIGCAGLRNKTYHILNTPVSKTEYEGTIIKLHENSDFRAAFIEKYRALQSMVPRRYGHIVKTIDSTGDYLFDSKNCHESFELRESEDCHHAVVGGKNRDLFDTTYADEDELMYEIMSGHHGYGNKFCSTVWFSQNVSYSLYCMNSNNLFGCDGIQKGSYCILNKQYAQKEYEDLVQRIIIHMNAMPYHATNGIEYTFGDFFPSDLSPFAYNETVAQEFRQFSKDEAITKGYRWKEIEERQIKDADAITQASLHDDTLVKKVFRCNHEGRCREQCTGVFKIVQQELSFYRSMELQLPSLCPNCRHYQRIAQRNPFTLHHRQCMCQVEPGRASSGESGHDHVGRCPVQFKTTYATDRAEIVYCEACYQKEIV